MLVILAAIVATIPLIGWIADRRARSDDSLPLIFPIAPPGEGESPVPPYRHPEQRAPRQASVTPVSGAAPTAPFSPHPSPHPSPATERVTRVASVPPAPTVSARPGIAASASPVAPTVPPVIRSRPPLRRGALAVLDDSDEHEVDAGETVRFRRPGDEPVQLVPGRLEVLAGEAQLREIRFVRVPGQPPQCILGREGGPTPQYVGLSSPTVSRRHAHFFYGDGCWKVKNLSKTNPLVVNDDELSDASGERTLVDGDRLEVGEVVLRFHAH